MPTDTKILDWLDKNAKGYGKGWICRNSMDGRELLILRESAAYDAKPTVRGAIIDAMKLDYQSWVTCIRCGCKKKNTCLICSACASDF